MAALWTRIFDRRGASDAFVRPWPSWDGCEQDEWAGRFPLETGEIPVIVSVKEGEVALLTTRRLFVNDQVASVASIRGVAVDRDGGSSRSWALGLVVDAGDGRLLRMRMPLGPGLSGICNVLLHIARANRSQCRE